LVTVSKSYARKQKWMFFLNTVLRDGIVFLTQNAALIDVEDYRYNDANITALQLVDVKAAFTHKVVDEMMTYQMRTGIELLARLQPPYLTVDSHIINA